MRSPLSFLFFRQNSPSSLILFHTSDAPVPSSPSWPFAVLSPVYPCLCHTGEDRLDPAPAVSHQGWAEEQILSLDLLATLSLTQARRTCWWPVVNLFSTMIPPAWWINLFSSQSSPVRPTSLSSYPGHTSPICPWGSYGRYFEKNNFWSPYKKLSPSQSSPCRRPSVWSRSLTTKASRVRGDCRRLRWHSDGCNRYFSFARVFQPWYSCSSNIHQWGRCPWAGIGFLCGCQQHTGVYY